MSSLQRTAKEKEEMGSGFEKQNHTVPQKTTAKSEGRKKNPKSRRKNSMEWFLRVNFIAPRGGKRCTLKCT